MTKTENIKQIDPKNLPDDAIILDVRGGCEHSEASLYKAHYLVELPKLNPASFLKEYRIKNETLYILCKSGKRAIEAANKFVKSGYKNVVVIEGGIDKAEKQGCAINKQGHISLERQVRIAAGSIVALGILLGIFVSSYWLILPLFMGGGLIYAGITNFCGLAIVLSKMPWNKQ